MKINHKRLLAGVGSLGMAALLTGSSMAQQSEGGNKPADEGQPAAEQSDGQRPRGDRRDGDRPRGERRDGERRDGERRDGERRDGDRPGGMRPDPAALAKMMLGRFDKDGDQKLDNTELTAALTEMRSQMGGGPGGPGGPGGAQMVTQMLERNDANKDGKLTGEEIPERMRQGMARIDTNSDEAIDRAELERMMNNFGGGRGPRDGQPGDGNRTPRQTPAEE